MNPLLQTDSYKITHSSQYPPGTSRVYSYLESRGGKWKETCFFGLQYILQTYLNREIKVWEVEEARGLIKAHLGYDALNLEGWLHICRDHQGRLPLRIKAVPEGTIVPTSNVLMTVENTCPQCWWLTNYVESLLVQVWYPTTVATLSREAKKTILRYLERTGDPSLIDFKLHDFGFRGVSSVESAGIGGAAHLVNFKGTDTLQGLQVCRDIYHEPCAGFSIPASEHSTITSWGKEGEVEAYRNMLKVYPKGPVACVSDSFDIFKAVSELWGTALREEVLKRDGTLVIRPDSGYPPKVVLEVVDRLGKAFGFATNAKGFKVLNPHVRVIQGDGIDLGMIEEILHQLQTFNWSADNIAFGMGGGLLQQVNRDTLKFAFKCAEVEVAGAAREVFKDPITDQGKRSKAGRLALVKDREGRIVTVPSALNKREDKEVDGDLMQVVFLNGRVLVDHKLGDIRERAAL